MPPARSVVVARGILPLGRRRNVATLNARAGEFNVFPWGRKRPRNTIASKNRTPTLRDSPDFTVTLADLRPISGCTKTTVCVPAETDTPAFGVDPSGRPSRMQFEGGIELMLSVA